MKLLHDSLYKLGASALCCLTAFTAFADNPSGYSIADREFSNPYRLERCEGMPDAGTSYFSLKSGVKHHQPAVQQAAAASKIPAFRANIGWLDSWEGLQYAPYGIYDLPSSNGTPTAFYTDRLMYGNYGSVLAGDIYRITTVLWEGYNPVGLMVAFWRLEDGEFVYDGGAKWNTTAFSTSLLSTALAYDEETGRVYGMFMDDGYGGSDSYALAFGYLEDAKALKVNVVKQFSIGFNVLAFSPKGELFGINENGQLVQIDKTTGKRTFIGNTGLQPGGSPQYGGSAVIDEKGEVMYYALCNENESTLYTVNLKTAEATPAISYSGMPKIRGMYAAQDLPKDKAPAAPGNMAFNFAKGSLTGEVTFSMPTTVYDGTKAEGQLNWTLYVRDAQGNKVLTTDGEASYGSTLVTAPLDFTQFGPGEYNFVLQCSNSVGNSPKTVVMHWIGADIPAQLPYVSLTYSDGNFKIEWPAVTAGTNPDLDGYFDPKQVKYIIYRQDGSEVFKEPMAITSYTEKAETPDQLTSYWYTVVPVFDGQEGRGTSSNSYLLGCAPLPYLNDFSGNGYSSLRYMFRYDGNGDGKTWFVPEAALDDITWEWYYYICIDTGNSFDDKDDWVVTPGVKLTKDEYYEYSFAGFTANLSTPDAFEVKVATSPTPEAMEAGTDVIPMTTMEYNDWHGYNGGFIAPEDGVYYFGLHAKSSSDATLIYARDIAISTGYSTDVPAPVANLTGAPDPNGGTSATLTFDLPTTTLAGEPLETIDFIEVYRDGSFAGDMFDGYEPGTMLKFIDGSAPTGLHKYSVVVGVETSNGDLVSPKANISLNIGAAIPSAVTDIVCVEKENTGTGTVSWNAPQTDTNGYPMAQNIMWYMIKAFDVANNTLLFEKADVFDTVCDFTLPEDYSGFVRWEITPKFRNSWGYTAVGTLGESKLYYLGKPLEYPFVESVKRTSYGYTLANPWDVQQGNYNGQSFGWGLVLFNDVNGLDDDYAVLTMAAPEADFEASLTSGKIEIPEDAKNPYISYFCYNIYDDDYNEINVEVSTDGNNFTTINNIVLNEYVAGWNRINVDIADYKGKTIQVRIRVVAVTDKNTVIDRIEVAGLFDKDMAASALDAPFETIVNQDVTLLAKVFNNGLQNVKAGESLISLYRNEEKIATSDCPVLTPGASATVTFKDRIPPTLGGEVKYYSIVEFEGDENLINNATSIQTMEAIEYPYPTTQLSGNVTKEGEASLSWLSAEYQDPGDGFSDGFEDYEPWAGLENSFGDWTINDMDKGTMVGLSGYRDWPSSNKKGSFFVVDVNEGDLYDNIQAQPHSGGKMIVTMMNDIDFIDRPPYIAPVDNDDWLISPEISAHGVYMLSFWARSYKGKTGAPTEGIQSFRVLVSQTDNDPNSFTTVLMDVPRCPAEWTEFEMTLPEGTKYFAIQVYTEGDGGADMFMLDDISLKSFDLEAKGYNLYRDGICLNEQPLSDLTYLDTEATIGEHAYVVTVVWDKGESQPSNVVKIITTKDTGISAVEAGAMNVAVQGRNIIVTGEAALQSSLFSVDGKVMGQRQGERAVYTVEPGIYLVKAQGKTVRVIVR